MMAEKPTYEELEQRIHKLEQQESKQKKAEEALRESEERMRSVVENSPVGIAIYDKTGQCFIANDSMAKMVGAPKEQVIELNYNDIEAWKVYGILDKAKNVIKEDINIRFELIAESTFGQIVRLDCYLVPFASGQLLFMASDITDRKQAEEALRESEEKYKLLANNVSDLIWTMDMNFNYTYVSPSITNMLGFTVEEGLARTAEESITPASFDNAMKVLAEELELHTKGQAPLDRSRKIENELFRKDGSTIWTEAEVTFIYDAKRQPTGIIGVTRNITERKNAEKRKLFQRDLAVGLSKTKTLEETLEKILIDIFQLDEFDSGAVYLFDEKTDWLVIMLSKGLPQRFADEMKYIYTDDNRIQMVMEGTPFFLPACECPAPIREDLEKYGLVSLAVVPIGFRGKVIGSINLASSTHDTISDYSMSILESISEIGIGVPIFRVKAEEALSKANEQLEEKVKERTREIEEKNIALRVLLNKRNDDKTKLAETVMFNVKELLTPNINKLKNSRLSGNQQTVLGILEINLNEITSPLVSSLPLSHMKLTPTEIQVANYIKHGVSSKEIANSLGLSRRTIDAHRYNIRQKLGIRGEGTNLRTFLLSHL